MSSHELWQIEVNDRVYDATIEEVIEWIHEGSVLPEDKVRRGSLRWLPASRVPEFYRHFLGSKCDERIAEPILISHNPGIEGTVITITSAETVADDPSPDDQTDDNAQAVKSARQFCASHLNVKAVYTCGTCDASLCSLCPNRFGNVRICPSCGGMCLPFTDIENADNIHGALNKPYARKALQAEGASFFDSRLGRKEILDALTLPFRHWKDLLLCSVFFSFLVFGIGLTALGDISAIAASVSCCLIATALMSTIFWKVSQNIRNGNTSATFFVPLRPKQFRTDFWRPFKLGLAALCVTFGVFAVLVVSAGLYAWYQFSSSVDLVESEMRSTQERTVRVLSIESLTDEKAEFEKTLGQSRENLINSVLGREYSVENPTISKMTRSFMRLSVTFMMPLGFAFLFGMVMFPAACANAAYSGSIKRTMNPLAVLGSMKQSVFDYLKVLFISTIALSITAGSAFGVYNAAAVYALALVALLGSVVVIGTIWFYFWVVFARLISNILPKEDDLLADG